MPKKIENIPRLLLDETKRQIARQGYGKTTVRSVASACGIAVGTVYNYFPSKDSLIASFVAEDWRETLAAMERSGRENARARLRTIYDGLLAFCHRHRELFSDPEAAKAASGALLTRHLQLREQLAALIEPYAPSDDGFAARFLAEAMLTWTISDTPFERIYEIMAKLIPNRKEDIYEQL